MENELKLIYRILSDGNFHSSIELSNHLNLSDRTCRKYVKELCDILSKHNINIISKTRFGYRLEGNILKESDIFSDNSSKIPITTEERQAYLINKLLIEDKYIKLDEISESIYIGTKTLSNDIKKIEKNLKIYNLTLERKPYYGLKISGDEINIRNYLIDGLEKRLNENKFFDKISKYSLSNIAKITYNYLKNNDVKISDISLQNLVAAIYITFYRVELNKRINKINFAKNSLFLSKREIAIALIENLFENLCFKLDLDDNDLDYITIHFLTTETLTYKSIKAEDINEVHDIIEEILYFVKLTFKINLYNDEILYKNLYTHILALCIRIRFDIIIHNPLIDDIKKNMPLEYNIATYVCKLISKRFDNKKTQDAEIGYIAVILHMSKGINLNNSNKKNVLIVCPSGRGVSKFLVYTYNNLFSEYINLVFSCGENELLDMDLENIDVIFTLIDLKVNLEKPVYKTNYFLDDNDILKIKNILKGNDNYIKKIIPKDLFIYVDKEITKDEIISLMSEKLKTIPNMNMNIEELIHKKEKNSGMTEISNEVAIPHPTDVIENVNVIGVLITKKSVRWINNDVNIILFLLLDNKNNKNDIIYKSFTKLVENKENIENILSNPTYDNLINILENLGGK